MASINRQCRDAGSCLTKRGERAPCRRNLVLAGAAWCCLLAFIVSFSRPASQAQSGRRTNSTSTPTTETVRPPRRNSSAPPDSAEQTPAANLPATTQNKTAAAPVEVDEEDVVRIAANLVPIPASVIDGRGLPVSDLKLKDFELRVDGALRDIGDLSRAETPVMMAVLFDNSSSLTAAREFQKQAAVRFFKSVLRPVDQAALYSVSTDSTLVAPLTNNVQTLVHAINGFGKPEGATALFDAIDQAAEYLRIRRGRKVIIIVSDGVDTSSHLDFDTTLRHTLAADCQVYAVQTGNSDNTNLRDLAAERRMQEITAQTGGALYVPRGESDLDRAFTQIAADLAQQYVLSYYPTSDRHDGGFHSFTLRITRRPDLRVRTRRGYYAPKG
ncbi:MAG: VWA domain-containing protein [Acidobacteriota bacterium]|nr:VWA domain-containing protein [Acidobacteriota bacterium]